MLDRSMPGRGHDARLAQAVCLGDGLENGELARCHSIADAIRKQAVRPLARAMQKMHYGLQRRQGRRRTSLWHGTFAGGWNRPWRVSATHR